VLIIGERINSTRKSVQPALREKNESFVIEEARKQKEAGAQYIDVNVATMGDQEPAYMEWAVKTIQGAVDVPLSIDSPNPSAIEAGLQVHQGRAFVNSVTAEAAKLEAMVPLVRDYDANVIALCMDDQGIPNDARKRCEVASRLVEHLTRQNIPSDRIYLDPLVYPVSTSPEAGQAVLETLRFIRENFPQVHTICGLSNVSFGLPVRKLLNQAFLLLCMGAGLEAAILDPTDQDLMRLLCAGEALLGRDQFCARYLQEYRAGKLGVAPDQK